MGYAVPSFCTWDAESVKTVLDVAEEMKAPVMVMNGWAEFPVIRPALREVRRRAQRRRERAHQRSGWLCSPQRFLERLRR